MQKIEKYPHPLSQVNSNQLSLNEDEVNLAELASVLRRRIFLLAGVTGVVVTGVLFAAESVPPVYQGSFEILTKPVTGESQVLADVPQTISPGVGGAPEKEVLTTIKVLESHRVLDSVIKKLQPQYPSLDYESIVGGALTIRSTEEDILQVTYTNPDRKLVTDFTKLLAASYLNYSLADRQLDVDQGLHFVDQQIKPLEEQVKFWQDKLRDIRVENKMIEPGDKSQQITGAIAKLSEQRLDNRLQLEEMIDKYNDLQKELAKNLGERSAHSVLTESGNYQKILGDIQNVDLEIQKQSALFTDNNPAIVTLKQQKLALLPLLEEEQTRVQRTLQSRIRELSDTDRDLGENIHKLNNDIGNLANIVRNYNNIQRQLQIATSALDQFTTKQQGLRIEKAEKQQPWELLDPKLEQVNQPPYIGVKTQLYLTLGGVLGLVLGIGSALVADKLSNIFYSSKELKDASRVPMLGIVPLRKELGAAIQERAIGGSQLANHPSFFEVFRSLYTNILLLGSDSPIRSIVISSAGQGDGKSTVAAQLAQAAAAIGQRVLLVDANLRAPNLHRQLGLMNIQGLTDVISQDLDWHNIIERSPQEENLFVMTAGPVPPDSVRLLASRKMQVLMENLQESFDLVIYDTPPLLGFADAYLLAANTNGIVLVAGLGQLKRTALKQVLEEIQISGTPMLGIIANKSKEAVPASYDYYQRYYNQNIKNEKVSQTARLESENLANGSGKRQ